METSKKKDTLKNWHNFWASWINFLTKINTEIINIFIRFIKRPLSKSYCTHKNIVDLAILHNIKIKI